ncbi:hypothetical protein ACWDWV_14390 [Streptosporangium sandarakinum]
MSRRDEEREDTAVDRGNTGREGTGREGTGREGTVATARTGGTAPLEDTATVRAGGGTAVRAKAPVRPGRRLALAAAAGAAAELAGLGLIGSAAWLITRAAEQPPLAALSVAIVGVRAFATTRGVLRYGERLAGHDVALRAQATTRERLYEALIPAGLPGRRGADLLSRMVDDTDAAQDLLVRVLLPAAAALVTTLAAVVLAAFLCGLVMGGRLEGGSDHVLYGMIAKCLGADARLLQYAGYPGTADAVEALRDGRVAAILGSARSFTREIAAGRLRPLVVSSADRLPGIDAPTLMEMDVRLEYTDWCGVFGPRDMGPDDRDRAVALCDALDASPRWRAMCEARGWSRVYLSGDDFRQWLTGETGRARDVLRDLGLLKAFATTCWGSCVRRHYM